MTQATAETSRTIATDAPLNAFTALAPLADTLAALEAEAQRHADAPDPALAQKARDLRENIRSFEPGVTLIGQVKAGKTTLVNAMCGWPALLPADVNPWTSVVTALHLAPTHRPGRARSAFRFFSNEEWDNLIHQGGRIGEIASRAGAADEMAKVRAQLDDMRDKSRQRLGRRFEMLLGQTHSYDTLDPELVKRYVSMGDDFWEDAGTSQTEGRFADITKTADLWFPGPDLPVGLCIQDTPGVNDTFMIREQITLAGLRGSRLCVVVLSAQQALSSVDLGLIRLISNVKSRDVVIFVNRIDELADPSRDVPNIRASISETLARFDGPTGAKVIFGSAYWAEHAVSGTLNSLGADSAQTLMNWAETQVDAGLAQAAPRDIIWTLSGVPALGQAISERIETGAAQVLIDKTRSALTNLETGAQVIQQARAPSLPGLPKGTDLSGPFDAIARQAAAQLETQLDAALAAFDQRAQNAHRTFLDRATGELVKHLESYGEDEVWSYDPAGLRMLLRTAYKVFTAAANKATADALDDTADQITALFYQGTETGSRIVPPPLPTAEAPVSLAQTVALDLKGSWWSRFWRKRRGYQAFAEDFARLIAEETAPMPVTLRADSVQPHLAALKQTLAEFVADQRDLAMGLVTAQNSSANVTGLRR